jgi:predicted PurR-regulated permease PerM
MLSNSPPSLTSPPWSGRTKRTVVLIVGGLLFFLVLKLLQAWTIVIVATILSYLLNPIVNLFENRLLYRMPFSSLRRPLGVLFTFVLIFTTVILAIIVIVPPLVDQTEAFAENLPESVSYYRDQLEENLSFEIQLGTREVIVWEEIERILGEQSSGEGDIDIIGALGNTASTITSPVIGAATLAITFLFNLLFLMVIMFYLMKDGGRFINNLDNITPVEYQGDVRRLIFELSMIWDAYLRGQLLLGLIVGMETAIAATILGLPQPLVLALIAAFLEFIPNLGPILAAIPAVLFALISPSTTIPGLEGLAFALVVMGVYTFIQQSEALFIVPRVMGSSLDLHPVVILVGVISGAALGGILGIILAAPVMATARLFLIYIWGKLLDFDPFMGKGGEIAYAPTSTDPYLASTQAPALRGPIFPEEDGEIVED